MQRHEATEKQVRAHSDWQSLFDAARAGDRAALGELCERLRPQLLRLANRDLGQDLLPKVAASDVVQASMLEAVDAFEHFVGEREADFQAWVQRIVSNNLIDVARVYRNSQKRRAAREIPIDAIECTQGIIDRCRTASSIARRKETDLELLRLVARLPERRRQIVELRFRDGLSHGEIGQVMGITEVAARKFLSRAIEQLRSMLSKQEVPG